MSTLSTQVRDQASSVDPLDHYRAAAAGITEAFSRARARLADLRENGPVDAPDGDVIAAIDRRIAGQAEKG